MYRFLVVLSMILALAADASCKTEEDCSLNGACVEGQCVCDAGWRGVHCASLSQGSSYRVWPPQGTEGQDQNHLTASWGAGLVGPISNVSSKWHLYVDVVCLGPPPIACSHTDHAQIVHAVSDNVEGPYQFADVAVPPSANNPAAVYDPTSKLYLLYYLDMCLSGPPLCAPLQPSKCTGQLKPEFAVSQPTVRTTAETPTTDSKCTNAGECARFAIRYAESPFGPWQRIFPDISSITPPGSGGRQSVVANAAPLIHPNGSVLLVYRYNPPDGRPAGETLAVAFADSWRGPYNMIADNLTNVNVTGDAPNDNRAEDPYLFQNRRGYHIVFHQYNQSDHVTGGHMYSVDAINWKTSTEAVYDVAMSYANGTKKRVDHRERPTLLTDSAGNPQWLITGVEVGSKSSSFPQCFSETALTKIVDISREAKDSDGTLFT